MDQKVSWQKLSWKEVEEILPKVETVLIPTGSVEQHGPHLALEHDSRSVISVCEEVARRLYPRVLVAPCTFLGYAPHNMSKNYRGTITLRVETFIEIIFDILRSLQRFGVKRVVVVNGHGGNVPLLRVATRRAREELNIIVANLSYWDVIPEDKKEEFLHRVPGHAGEFETSFALAKFPENVRKDLIPEAEPDYAEIRGENRGIRIPFYADEWLPLGCTDDPQSATKETGEKGFELAVSGLVSYLERFIKYEPRYGWHQPF